MFIDPVVEEMRKNGARIAAECGRDIRRIADRLRREQSANTDRVASSRNTTRPWNGQDGSSASRAP